MKQVTVSAPGKLMLLGEHAVLYGRPCIVTAINQRITVTASLDAKPLFTLSAPDVQIENYQKPLNQLGKGDIPKGARFVEMALYNFYNNYNRYTKKSGVRVTTQSEFSSWFGLGSSSASAVCVIKALSELSGIKLDKPAIFNLAYKTILAVQGKASGFDAAASVFGGTLYYISPGKTIEPLNIDCLPLVIGYSGVKADTVTLVNQVAEKARKNPQAVESIYDNIGKLVQQAKLAILSKDWPKLGKLLNNNQLLLEKLGVSSNRLDDIISAARSSGAYGAKLSGAGGGDCMIALYSPEGKLAVSKAIKSAGGQIIDIKTNAEGVRIEK